MAQTITILAKNFVTEVIKIPETNPEVSMSLLAKVDLEAKGREINRQQEKARAKRKGMPPSAEDRYHHGGAPLAQQHGVPSGGKEAGANPYARIRIMPSSLTPRRMMSSASCTRSSS